ncbi:MAG: hypothetical protein JNL11_17240 [Bdellovibrionaceae bacterium]|nr:hypothetical protein [Pseudobdellovibrionaceae bacterium]
MRYVLSIFLIGFLTACNRSSDSGDFALLESGGKGNPACKIVSTKPENKSFRVGAASGVKNQFIVQANSESCVAEYLVNDVVVKAEGLIAELDSSVFKPGENKVKVNLVNSTGAESFEWTITKNNPPTCNSQSPTNLTPSMSAGAQLQMTVQSTDADNDPLQFNWKYNGVANSTLLVPIISSSTASQISFQPQPENGGTQSISAAVTDGYDTVSCTWSVRVTGDCSITSKTPDVTGNLIRILSPASTQNSFAVSTVTAGCEVQWAVNGAPLTGTGSSKLLNSSQFSVGNNILTATVTGATGQSSQTWNVVKNSPPSCGSMTPSNLTTQTTGISQNLNLSLTASDINSDTLSFNWQLNNQTVSSAILSSSSTGATSSATFIPTIAQVGANSVAVVVSDSYESTTCSWPVQVLPGCEIASSSPDHIPNQRFAASASTITAFNVTPNNPGYCSVTWAIDGTNVGTGTLYSLVSTNSLLSVGTNHTLTATVTNGSGSTVTRNWNLVKNSPPSCDTLTPSNTSLTMTQGATQVLQAAVSDSNGDNFNFAWKLNGSTAAVLATLGSTASSSSAQFSPTIANVGNNIASLSVSDGYDTTQCFWNIAVQGSCSLTGFTPSNSSPIKIKANDVVGSIYTINTSTAGCPVTWSINGTPVSGHDSFKTFNSSHFSPGNNILQAVVTDGVTPVTTTWTVKRNNLPTANQTPTASTVHNLSINSAYNFMANMADVDSDTLTATWKVNGVTVGSMNPPITFTSLSATNPFQGRFSFNGSYTGSRALTITVNDGTDDVDLNWDLMVYNNCLVTSSFPSGATQRVSVQNNITTTYGIIPNDSSCVITWKLNGNTVSTGNLFNLSSLNGSLMATNTLTASLDNGVGTPTTQSWTIVKNTVPTCLIGQTPAATGNELFYNSTMHFTCQAGDTDGDAVSFTWKLNNAYPELFSSISAVSYDASATLNPTVGVLGATQSVTSSFYDGWDTGVCQWAVNIKDPAAVQIQACSPVQGATTLLSKVQDSPVKYDIKTFTVSATGPDITYRWKENGTLISGQTTAQLKVATNSTDTSTGQTPDKVWSVGTRPLVVEVVDKYNNVQSCTWNLKRNRIPTINTAAAGTAGTGLTRTLDSESLTSTGKIRMNYGSTLQLRIYGTDADTEDAGNLTYYWKINNQQLPAGGDSFLAYTTAGDKSYSTATITPNYVLEKLGAMSVTAVISDGFETVSFDWNLEVNMFSRECNKLYNATIGERGGQVCTLVGQAGVGGDRYPASDMTKMRMQPWSIIYDGNNIMFSDNNTHSVFYWNKGTSPADDVTRFGKSIPYGQIVPILGLGGGGITPNKSVTADPFKLNNPRSMVYHGGRLYVGDMSNHRIVVLKENGVAESLVGRVSDNAWPSNVTAANATTPTSGVTQICYDANGLIVFTEGPNTFLYAACRNTIRKINITDPSNIATYGFTQIVVGRLNSGVMSDGLEDGDPLTEARTQYNVQLAKDSAGNLYWTEREGRLRVLNRTASTIEFFPGRTLAAATSLVAIDSLNSGGIGTSTRTTRLQAVNASANTANKVTLMGPTAQSGTTAIGNGMCYPFRAQLQDASNLTAIHNQNVDLTMSASGGSITFHTSLANCISNTTNNNYTIVSGQRYVEFWVKGTANASGLTVTATSNLHPTIATGALGSVQVIATSASAANSIAFVSAPNSMHFQDCERVLIQPSNSTNPVNPANTVKVRFYAGNGGNFYASNDPTCSGTPINSITYSGNATSYTEGFIYYARTTKVAAGKVGTLLSNPVAAASVSATAFGPVANAAFRWGFGLSVYETVNGIHGFFISNYDNYHIGFLNNLDANGTTSSSLSIGNTTFGSSATSTGLYHQYTMVTGSGACAFNGDTKVGTTSRVCVVTGLTFDPSGSNLMIADTTNWRLRKMNLSNGVVSTDLGSGRFRYGWYGDAIVQSEDAVMDQPTGLIYDPSNKYLFVSDMRNGRIRKVDLTKGSFETFLGRGRATGVNPGSNHVTVPSEDKFGMFLGGPMQMALYKTSGVNAKDFLLFADSTLTGDNQVTGPNTTCAIRAHNRNLSQTRTIFGEDVSPDKINNIIGDYALGCVGTTGFGQNGLLNSLLEPVGLITDMTNLYISDVRNHCILKLDSNGDLKNFIGRCGTSGSNDDYGNGDNNTNPTLVTFPTEMVIDPMNTSNFFFIEGHNQSTGKIRYANTGSGNVAFPSIAGGQATGKGVAEVKTTTLWTFAPTNTTARLNGLTAFENKWVCVSTGGSGSNTQLWTDVNTGTHGVYCFDRTDPAGNLQRVIGSNPTSSTRGGSQIGTESELKAGTQIQLYQPHGIAFDADGNLYIAERGSHVVRMVKRWW